MAAFMSAIVSSVNRGLLIQLSTTLVVFITIKVGLFYRKRFKRYQLFKYYGIPGPKPDLLGGNLWLYKQKFDSNFRADLYCHQKYGKTYGIFIGDEPSIMTSDLEILRKIFFEKASFFTERTKLFLHTTLSHSILFAPFHRWKAMRKSMSSSFSSYTMRGSESVQFVEDSISLMMNYIENKMNETALNQGGQMILDIQDLMKAAALHMISNIAIRLDDVEVKENEENVKSLDAFLSLADNRTLRAAIQFPFINIFLNFIASHFEYDRTISLIHKNVEKLLDSELKRLATKEKNSPKSEESLVKMKLIDILIRLHHQGKMTRTEVIGNADAILFAGYDTTSTTLTYVFWVLGKFQDVQKTLRDDLMTYGTESRYLDQVINETMRLYPTVSNFTSRLATETVVIDGLTIPQGTKVIYNSWLMHRNAEYWPEPLKFDPERFKSNADIHPCAFAPFGLGDRKCLGYQLAKLEMKMIICDMLLRYKISTESPQDLELVSYANVLTKPREKVLIRIERV